MNVVERFLKYVSFDTRSDENSESCPSTSKQKILGEYIENELKTIGLLDVSMDQNGYVYGFLPSSKDYTDKAAIGLIAHMDTSPDVTGTDAHPQIIEYTGGNIALLNGESICEASFPSLKNYVGEKLIVTDGNTLLGADDKAGIAEIITACEFLAQNQDVPHRAIAVCFTPDEEIGRGADLFDFKTFKASEAYTVDGGELGEIEYENFNAASAVISIKGVNIHPGTAKGKMKNAVLLAAHFVKEMPENETPATTEGYEGFYHISDITACESEATISMIIRDHDREKFENRKAFVEKLTSYMNSIYGEGTFTVQIKDSYYNMKEKILPCMHLIDNAEAAMKSCGVTPKIVPIRGGTDGARLSYEGLPCPNLSTGGENAHSIHEFIPVSALEKMTAVILELVKL